jgi:hypothetical protein
LLSAASAENPSLSRYATPNTDPGTWGKAKGYPQMTQIKGDKKEDFL